MVDFATISTWFNEWGMNIVQTWGYLGIFLVSLVGNASIILPIPSYLIVVAFGGILNPWLLGIVGGAGAAVGELTGYALGRGGKHVIEKKYEKLLSKTKKWSEKHGLFPVLILFAATPLPDDIVGILGGVVSYDIKKFFTATLIGKIIAYSALAWAGFYGGQLLGAGEMLFSMALTVIFLLIVIKFVTGEIKPEKLKKLFK